MYGIQIETIPLPLDYLLDHTPKKRQQFFFLQPMHHQKESRINYCNQMIAIKLWKDHTTYLASIAYCLQHVDQKVCSLIYNSLKLIWLWQVKNEILYSKSSKDRHRKIRNHHRKHHKLKFHIRNICWRSQQVLYMYSSS